MRILRMTATFGKLENQTLELQPGLNVISAPNEWGKTTWCTFLATMLYGLDTREKTTKTTIAIKERYAPWSGSPMSGRIDLEWEGKAITIERWSNKRTPFGEFKSYETASGLPVSELTASNCGEVLLGVEKSVFLRAGFLRLADLPVTADDALRRRLNALVTTGDESGAADTLAQKLKDLKNKCRSNRTTGLIPQAEVEKLALEEKLQQLQQLKQQSEAFAQRQVTLNAQLAALENHAKALEFAAVEENNRRIAAAQDAARLAHLQLQTLQQTCQGLVDAETARKTLHTIQDLQQKQQQARLDAGLLPPAPQEPQAPMCFYGLNGEQALQQAQSDATDYRASAVPAKKRNLLWPILAALAAVLGLVLLSTGPWIPGAALLAAGFGLLLWQILLSHKESQTRLDAAAKQQAIAARYGGGAPEDWLAQAQLFAQQRQSYEAAMESHNRQRQLAAERITQLDEALATATAGMGVSAATEHFSNAIRQHNALADGQKAYADAKSYAENMAAMAKMVEKPEIEDLLQHSPEQTQQLLSQTRYQLQQLQQLQGQTQGRMDALGSEAALRQTLAAINARLEKLRQYFDALELAQQTLQTAKESLQRRFAPRIADSAREMFGQLTGGRYDKLYLTQDLTVDTSTGEEVATRSIQWRSDGTMDQLYLALRLAVAKELTPAAPLILDDALVRFDDTRHALAMELLRREAEHKQILLFTCQTRECP